MLLAAWTLAPGGARGAFRERALDTLLPLLLRQYTGEPNVAIVDVDRPTLARFGPWPWPRKRMADLVSAAAANHPAALAFDVLFAGTDRFSGDGDRALAQALSIVPSALGFVLETTNTGQDLPHTPILFRGPLSLPGLWRAAGVIGPLPPLTDASQGMGALIASADPDGLIRRIPMMVMAGNLLRPSLAVEAIRLAEGATALMIASDGKLIIGALALPLGRDAMLRLVGLSSVPTISATRLLGDHATTAALAGKIVLIGSSAPEAGGIRGTSGSPATPSVFIQAEAIEAILHGQVLTRPAWADVGEFAGATLLGLLCILLAIRLRPAPAAILAILICLSWTTAAAGAVRGTAALVDPTGPPTIAIITFIVVIVCRFVSDEWRFRLLRSSFEQHLAPEVVRRIAVNPGVLRLQGELREVTALFTDIEDFTSMTERAEPVDLVALLDVYFDITTRIVTDHGGMIDKIVGDSIHAIFNAPLELEDHPRLAVASALALIKASDDVRRSPLGQRLNLGRTRIGIETGPAIVGDIGGSRKLDYTAHGNAINAAARLEAANKDLGTAICIGPGTAARLKPTTVRQIGTLSLRGQSGQISVYTPAPMT
jgi:adenylate cyclase